MFGIGARNESLENGSNTNYDLAIVGGGITGAGVARDAASRGMKVLLLEASDFASGTSSRSSKLVHGGIRYLENFEFPLVYEALAERKILLETAPHLVHPLRFIMPIYKQSRVGRFKMGLGMILYDILSLFESPRLHESLNILGTKERSPLLKSKDLIGSFVYSDAYMDDDRLVIETLRSAHTMGADLLNYVRVENVDDSGSNCTLSIKDELSGQSSKVAAKHVVSCVGPWADFFGQQALKNWKPILRPTKGVHLVIPKSRLAVEDAVVMAVETRIIFVIPRGDMVIVGTTDTDFNENPGDVNTDLVDVEYVLAALNKYFPSLALTANDIVSCYSGIRPLVADGSSTEGKTSREHTILSYSKKVTCVAGGKYTTYRAMAEEIVDHILGGLPFETRMMWSKPKTDVAINPRVTRDKLDRALLLTNQISKDRGIPRKLVALAIQRRGEEAYGILANLCSMPGDSFEEQYWCAEAEFSIQNEMCLNLVDFYWRRSPLFLFYLDHGISYLSSIATIFARHLRWSDSYKEMQMSAVEVSAKRETKAISDAMR